MVQARHDVKRLCYLRADVMNELWCTAACALFQLINRNIYAYTGLFWISICLKTLVDLRMMSGLVRGWRVRSAVAGVACLRAGQAVFNGGQCARTAT